MLGSLSLVDILFLITIVLLVFNGFRNGFVFSIISLVFLPVAFAIAWYFGPQLTAILASNNLGVAPLIAYLILFIGTVLVVHILATLIRGTVRKLPLIGGITGVADTLLGGVLGFIEAWLLWVALLWVLQSFLQHLPQVPGITDEQFRGWQDFYNTAVSNSIFANVNSFILGKIQK